MIDNVRVWFICEEMKRSNNAFCSSINPAPKKFNRITVKFRTDCDVVASFIAAEISFRQVSAASLVSSTSGMVPRLLRLNEKLVQKYIQVVININLDKNCRLAVDAKRRAFSIAFESATSQEGLRVGVIVCMCVRFISKNVQSPTIPVKDT